MSAADAEALRRQALYWLRSHADAAWSAGFLAVWMKRIKPGEKPPYELVYALAGLVVDGLIRPVERPGASTLYQYITRDVPRLEELRFLDPDETHWPTAPEVRARG